MRVVFDKRRTIFIHDFDGVHYSIDNGLKDSSICHSFFESCAVQTFSKIFPNELTEQEILDISNKSYTEHGSSHVGFFNRAARAGMSNKDFQKFFNETFHAEVSQNVEKHFPEWLVACEETKAIFELLKGKVRHGLLTQGHFELWAKPVLEKKGLLKYFDQDCILDFDKIDYNLKRSSPVPIERAVESFQEDPKHMVFIDDSHQNLKVAKERFPDICTVLISNVEQSHEYVDIHAKSLLEFKRLVVKEFFPVRMRDNIYVI